jgi:hypothetical protein
MRLGGDKGASLFDRLLAARFKHANPQAEQIAEALVEQAKRDLKGKN